MYVQKRKKVIERAKYPLETGEVAGAHHMKVYHIVDEIKPAASSALIE